MISQIGKRTSVQGTMWSILLSILCAAIVSAASGRSGTPESPGGGGVDLEELDRYLARKLDIVANMTLAETNKIVSPSSAVGSIVYFGDYKAEETSVFQSSLSLLALLQRHRTASQAVNVGFVDTSTAAGDRLSKRLHVRARHAIVGWRGSGSAVRADFLGYRNVQLLLQFSERLTAAEPKRLLRPGDKASMVNPAGEAVVLLLPEEAEDEAASAEKWTKRDNALTPLAVEVAAFVGFGRRMAAAFGAKPGSLVYRSAVTGGFSVERLPRRFDSRKLSEALKRLRAESAISLGLANLYLPAVQSYAWDDLPTEEGRGVGGGGAVPGKPLLVLLADPDNQPSGAAAMALMKRLIRERQQLRAQNNGPAEWLAALLNPWRDKAPGEPSIDWSGILGGIRLDVGSGPCFLLTRDRDFGAGQAVGDRDVFWLDDHSVDGDHDTVLRNVRRWLQRRISWGKAEDDWEWNRPREVRLDGEL